MRDPSDRAQTGSGSRDPLSDRIRRHLDASERALDEPALERLAQARREALAAAARHSPAPGHSWPVSLSTPVVLEWLLPAGAMASVAVMVLALSLLVKSPPVSTAHSVANTAVLDIDLLSARQNLDVYDNLDFYRWLAANDRAG